MSKCHWSVPEIRNIDRDERWNHPLERVLPLAKAFFDQCFPIGTNLAPSEIDPDLWLIYARAIATEDTDTQFGAELCLRCRISHLISTCCRKLAHNYRDCHITWHDLFLCFPYDDGSRINWQDPNAYKPFTVEVLQAYDPNRPGKVSLAALVQRMVDQSNLLDQFLLEHSILRRSDWALLNRATLSELSTFDVAIVKAFHQVYRRDRRRQHTSKTDGHCPRPTDQQLREMQSWLHAQGIKITSAADLEGHLTRIGSILRHREIVRKGGLPPTQAFAPANPEIDSQWEFVDESVPETLLEVLTERAFQSFYEQLLKQGWEIQADLDASLRWGVAQAISDYLTLLRSKPKRAHQADQFEAALDLLFCEGLSQAETGNRLGLRQDEVSVLVQRKKLRTRICDRTLEELLRRILQVTQQLGGMPAVPHQDDLDELTAALHSFLQTTLTEHTITVSIQQFLQTRRSKTP